MLVLTGNIRDSHFKELNVGNVMSTGRFSVFHHSNKDAPLGLPSPAAPTLRDMPSALDMQPPLARPPEGPVRCDPDVERILGTPQGKLSREDQGKLPTAQALGRFCGYHQPKP